jgi:hypothetical protein
MMRKLAAAAFILSFAALGCGSDSGTPPKKDGAASEAGTNIDATTQQEVAKSPDQALPSDVSPDVAQIASDAGTQPEAPAVVEAGTTTETGTSPVDTAKPDTQGPETQRIDGGADTKPGDVGPVIDGGDAGSRIDGGAIDGGSAG